jgi:S1-C subfamily serine protease
MFFSRGYRTGVALLLALLSFGVVAVGQERGPTKSPESRARKKTTESFHWLVTVIHELRLKDLIADLQAPGLQIFTPDDLPLEAQLITNVASGIVIDKQGRILAHLANFNVQPRINSITVITGDGRRLHPRSIETDQITGYAVLEVPELKIEPPPVAPALNLSSARRDVRLVYQVPAEFSFTTVSTESLGRAATTAREAGKQPESPDRLSVMRDAASARRAEEKDERAAKEAEAAYSQAIKLRVIEDVAQIALDKTFQQALVTTKQAQKRDVPASCGVVVTNQGELIGMTETYGPAKGIVKSIDQLRSLAERLKTQELSRRQGWLGVRLEQLTPAQVRQRFPATSGAKANLVVTEVITGGPSARAGLKAGDYLVRFNGEMLRNRTDLRKQLAAAPIGKEAPLEVLRDGKPVQLKLSVEPRPRASNEVALQAKPELEQANRRAEPVGPSWRFAWSHDWRKIEDLGITVTSLTEALREAFGVKETGGVLVAEAPIVPPAGHDRLRAGDVIVKVNDTSISSSQDLLTAITRAPSSGQLTFSVIRRKRPVTVAVELAQTSKEQ